MYPSPEQPISAETLSALGIEDAAKGLRLIRELAGRGVTDDDIATLLPGLFQALQACPDPDRALNSFARWFDSLGSRSSYLQLLRHHPFALDLFCLVTGSSQFFADLLVRQPEYFEIIADPGIRGGIKTGTSLYHEVSSFVDVCTSKELKRDALRRWKAREMLRIGVRDLAGLADMPTTAREFTNLADACIQKACEIAYADRPFVEPAIDHLPFAVIGMGKLGGQELNYSSDVDLLFVHGEHLPAEVVLQDGRRVETLTYVTRLAETIVSILAQESANGHVFRVDMRLRPEGRFGPLTRSLASFRAYYESWAESWERQALLKARVVAGDRSVGAAFMALVIPYIFRRNVSVTFLEEIVANKRRIEAQAELEGETQTNIKTGYGGIRDVEFLVQRMQLEFGGVWLDLRTTNTLSALQRLRNVQFLLDTEAQALSEDYQFLRTLEHRLQLLHGFQTQTLPTENRERARLARRMGFSDRAAFEAELAFRRDRVRGLLVKLFYGDAPREDRPVILEGWSPYVELLDNIESAGAKERLRAHLEQAGFQEVDAALRIFQLTMRGNEFGEMTPDTGARFLRIVPNLLEQLSRGPNPDAGLAGIEALALAIPSRAQLYASLEESPDLLRRLTQLGSASPPLMRSLAQHLEWLETLADPVEAEAETDAAFTSSSYLQAYRQRVQSGSNAEPNLDAIARIYQRELLRIGAQDIWQERNILGTMRHLTSLAEATLQILLDVAIEQIASHAAKPDIARRILDRVAIVGLGKLGGAEPGYTSDWDVVFVYDERSGHREGILMEERMALVNSLVEHVLGFAAGLVTRGVDIELDIRLRPWGRKGALAHSPHGFARYFRTSGETWERQAALKGRLVAGNRAVGHRLECVLRAVSFGQGISAEEDEAIRSMKRRIEAERLKPAHRETDLKLGHGGMSDIEWTVQRLQLRNGRLCPALRISNTLEALAGLAAEKRIEPAEAEALSRAYLLLARVRNAMWLSTAKPQDTLPVEPKQQQILARMLGVRDTSQKSAAMILIEEIHEAMREVRKIFLARFYEA